MNKITLLLFTFIISVSINAQTVAWSSDSEDYVNWSVDDGDLDTFNWGVYGGGGESFGFKSGVIFYSQSWDGNPAPNGTPLTPDNRLFTPAASISIPANATSINFKMKVAALDATYYAENFAVYVYDEDDINSPLDLIHEETLTSGGDGTAKDIIAALPVSYAGKNLTFLIRHYNCTDQLELLIDDFEVSYSTALSVNDYELSNVYVFPNPTKDIIKIDTIETIDKVVVVNQLGQRVLEINRKNLFNNKINLSSLSKGVYLMTVSAEKKSKTIKIIKE